MSLSFSTNFPFHKWANSIWNVASPDQFPFIVFRLPLDPILISPHIAFLYFLAFLFQRPRSFPISLTWTIILYSLSVLAPLASFSCWDQPQRFQGWTELKKLLLKKGTAHFQTRPLLLILLAVWPRSSERSEGITGVMTCGSLPSPPFTFFFPRAERGRLCPLLLWRLPWLHNSSTRPRRVPSPPVFPSTLSSPLGTTPPLKHTHTHI